jgi:hypothetical protein
MTDRHAVSETTTAPWRVDFYESATPLDTTLLGYGVDDVLLWARTRYAGIR